MHGHPVPFASDSGVYFGGEGQSTIVYIVLVERSLLAYLHLQMVTQSHDCICPLCWFSRRKMAGAPAWSLPGGGYGDVLAYRKTEVENK